LRDAADPLSSDASCQIDEAGNRALCRVRPNEKLMGSDDEVRFPFLNTVINQNLRNSRAMQP
jgi:hypothetical protein